MSSQTPIANPYVQQPAVQYKQQEVPSSVTKWKGMFSNLPLQAVPVDGWSMLLNMYFPGPYVVATRPGTTYLAQKLVGARIVGHFEFMKSTDTDSTQIIVTADGKIYSFNLSNPAGTLIQLGTTTNATPTQVWMAQMADKLYIADGVDALRWDGTNAASHITSIKSSFPPVSGGTGNITCVLVALSRMWWADSNNYLYSSDINDPDTMYNGAANYMAQVSYNDGATITGLAPWGNTVLIFKTNTVTQKYETFKLTGDGSSGNPFTVLPLYGDSVVPTAFVGKSALQINGDVFGLTKDGVTTVSAIQNFQSTEPQSISLPVDDIIQRINWQYANNITAIYDTTTKQYQLAIPLDGSAVNNYVLVLDLKADPDTGQMMYRWSLWNNWTISCWARIHGNIYYCDNAGSIIQTNYGTNDLGAGFQTIAESGNDHGGAPDTVKMWKSIEFKLAHNGPYPITFYWIVDDFAANAYNSVNLNLSNNSSLWDEFTWDVDYWDLQGSSVRTVLLLARGKLLRFRFYNNQPDQPFAISTLTKRMVVKSAGSNKN